ncbi:hypothetical protein [Lysobacter capsici]|uniref:hypothetical protein n=1 Tax=Lysobacter capsici TaxID=435897 RepID=UPI00287BB275|nr:hypothetical protein [Lysobacter capsici]WND82006.1 hypothetical protein RJ610_06500 [Lysobacter capsici]WND87202.1 hypothetical protein RJ609_06505 [Lysobacter capsici]
MSKQEFLFFLKDNIDEITLITTLNDTLGFKIASDLYRAPNSAGFAQITTFDVGFKCGCFVTYIGKDKINEHIIARDLAKKFQCELIFEMKASDKWLHVQPSGEQREVTVIDIDVGVDIAPD